MRYLFFLLVFSFSNLFGSYVGNICSPAVLQTGLFSKYNYLINITSGYVYDTIWDKKIKPSDQPDFVGLEKVNEFEIKSNSASFAVILLRRLEFYTYLGVSKETMDWTNKPQIKDRSEIKTKNHFSYTVGTKAYLFRISRFMFGADLQFFSLPSSNKLFQRIKNINLPFLTGEQYLKIKEWQASFGVAGAFGPFSPYGGVNYIKMRLRVKTNNDLPTLRFDNRNNWGVFCGLSLILSSNFYVNAEARFFNEDSVSAAVTTAF